MITLLIIIWIIMMSILVLTLAVHPHRTLYSWFELERKHDTAVMRREVLLGDIFALRRFVTVMTIIGLTAAGIAAWRWWGVVATIVAIIGAVQISSIPYLRKRVHSFYSSYEQKLLDVVEKFPIFGTILGADRAYVPDKRLESTQQLLHLVESANHILSVDQQTIISRGIDWHSISVSVVMTDVEDIISVLHSELLGPLVLHDLHESGHTVFPVIKEDLNHIVGSIDISDLLQVDKIKSSHTAEKVMNPDVVTVATTVLLPDALELLVSSRQPFLIVIDAEGATCGMVTLRDILEKLFGKNRGEVVK